MLLNIFIVESFLGFTSPTCAAFRNVRNRVIWFHFAALKLADFRKDPQCARTRISIHRIASPIPVIGVAK
jgi:hypothetical protein